MRDKIQTGFPHSPAVQKPPFSLIYNSKAGFVLNLIVPAVGALTTSQFMDEFLCLFAKGIRPYYTNLYLHRVQMTLIFAVQAEAEVSPSRIWAIIFK